MKSNLPSFSLSNERTYRKMIPDDNINDGDEYLDAFVALGGSPDKEGYVEKNTLIEIIKSQFELTIDMVVCENFIFKYFL